ncbi:MAG: hypothetical protein QOJ53_593 [Sphingomonadales bacterium]|jgi:hypothetical protein|nr:hypothetical protein [Sphingomonadales bacterium]MEA3043333.1 hypothetical protein [Sphingomonadales bacterium]MEA3046261.1 hypothetical protein [Sphingomonadales bacterium]
MRIAGFAALLILAGCGSGNPPAQNRQEPAPPPLKAPAVPKAEPVANAAGVPDDSGLAQMSPSRRRAYDRGFADCRAGRYDPDRYPEAYRIGCAAAHDSGPAPR